MVIGKIKLAPNNVAWYDASTRIVLNRKHPVHDVHDYHDMRNINAGVRAKLIIFIPELKQEPVMDEKPVEEPIVVDVQPVLDPVVVAEPEAVVEEVAVEEPAPKKRKNKKQNEGVEKE